MGLAILAIIALGVLVFAVLLVVWFADPRRSGEVKHDLGHPHTGKAMGEDPPLDPQRPPPGWHNPEP
jgi:hypothetical protein